jgi:hypothetical protein
LDYPAASATYLNGTNNYGLLIGYYVDSSGNPHSVTYSTVKSAWTVLPDIPEYTQGAQGSGINDDGIAVGYSLGYPFGTLSWIWCPNSQSYSFFTAPAAAEASTYPSGINHKMQLVGYAYTVPGSSYYPLGFLRRDDEEYETLNVPGSVGTFAVAINDSGTIAGWFETETTYFGFVQAGRGAVTAVNYPGYAGTFVDGINDFGTVCGNSYTASYAVQAFVAFPL